MMKEEKKNKNKEFIKEVIVILVFGLIINLFCFFICSITGHCANAQEEYYPFSWGYNEIGRQEDIETIINYMTNPNSNYYGYDNCFIRAVTEQHTNYTTIYYAVEYFGSYYNLYGVVNQQQPYSFDVYRGTNNQGTDRYTTATFAYGFNGTQRLELVYNSANFNGSQSSLYNPTLSYYSTFDTLYDANGNALIYTPIEEVPIGEFTDLPGLDQILNNITNTWNNSTDTTLPPTDNNATVSDNLRNFLSTMQGNLSGAINNLGAKIKSYFDNLQQKLTDVANSISQNIYNGFATLMQNLKDFFGPKIDAIIDKINWFLEPFSSEELADNLDNGSFSSDFLGLISSAATFGESLTSGTEPNSCKFTLDFSNSYYDFGVCEFSLDWILPMRPGIRLIIGCLCVYSLIVSIFTSINTYIGGTSSINDDI